MSIKNLVKTQGWKEIEKMMNDLSLQCKTQPIKDDMPANEYKVNHLANKLAAQKIDNLLNKIKLIGGVQPDDKNRYV